MRAQLNQIKASAGSGKTYELTQRFISMLSRTQPVPHSVSCPWEAAQAHTGAHSWGDIMAVTFTNAAATEMKARVLGALKGTALDAEQGAATTAAQASVWVDTILRQYGALNIRTIDSLLQLIVRTAALDLGLPPDFTPSFQLYDTLTPIFDAYLEAAWQGDAQKQKLIRQACNALVTLHNVKGFTVKERITQRLHDVLELMLTTPYNKASSVEQMQSYYDTLSARAVTAAQKLCATIELESLIPLPNAKKLFEDTATSIRPVSSTYLTYPSLQACLKKDSPVPSPEAEEIFHAFCPAMLRFNTEEPLLREGLRLHPFAVLCQEILVDLIGFQQKEGIVPAERISILAQEILNLEHGVSNALCRLGNRIRHILVDEFQDTSRAQWDALHPLITEALACGGSFTWVGDVKQAIYRWRGGDAALFEEVCHDPALCAIAPGVQRTPLQINWRSRQHIVLFNNILTNQLGHAPVAKEMLQVLLGKDVPEPLFTKYATQLADNYANAAQNLRPVNSQGGYVCITRFEGERKEDIKECVVPALHDRLRDIKTRHPWQDIAILVRSNDTAKELAQHLIHWGIPVITENSLRLQEHPLITETCAWLSWLSNSQDTLAFLCILSGNIMRPLLEREAEFCNLDIYAWFAAQKKEKIVSAFRTQFPNAWEQYLQPFYAQANLLSAYDSVQEWYRICAVERRFASADTFVRRFLEVVHNAEEHGYTTPGSFMQHWQKSALAEKLPMPESAEAVRIMTIHKAKGLQFPVVIIPGSDFSSGRGAIERIVPYNLGDLHFLSKLRREMGEAYYTEKAYTAMEAINLWYVACTRAEEELHIFHTVSTGKNKNNLGTALDVIFENENITGDYTSGTLPAAVQSTTLQKGEAPATEPLMPTPLPSPPQTWHPMDWMPRLKIFRNPLGEALYSPKQRGTLIHHCLEHLCFTGDTARDVARAVQHGMRTFAGIIPNTAKTAADIEAALMWFATLPDACHWLATGLPEQSILDQCNVLHRVDLLVPPQQPEGAWLCIDYKTGSPQQAHIAQIHRYLGLLAAKSMVAPVGLLLYLDQRCCQTITATETSALLPTPALPVAKGGQR